MGDELNWEQLISFIKERAKKGLWIISRDSDYCLTYGKVGVFLLPALRQELLSLTDPAPEVYAFTNIPDAVKHFSEITGAKADKLPIPARVQRIKNEQENLPPVGSTAQGFSSLGSRPSGSGSGAYFPEGSGALSPSGTGSYSGSGFGPQTWPAVPPSDYNTGSGSGSGSSGQTEQLFIHWNDGETSPMTFEGGVWKSPFERIDGTGKRVSVPCVEVRDQEVFVDGACYPIQSRYPFIAEFDHEGQYI